MLTLTLVGKRIGLQGLQSPIRNVRVFPMARRRKRQKHLEGVASKWKAFDLLWIGLSVLGKCDEYGGSEYKRVSKEWLEAGQPVKIVRFILERANRVPFI